MTKLKNTRILCKKRLYNRRKTTTQQKEITQNSLFDYNFNYTILKLLCQITPFSPFSKLDNTTNKIQLELVHSSIKCF